jgi:hypothetical protein
LKSIVKNLHQRRRSLVQMRGGYRADHVHEVKVARAVRQGLSNTPIAALPSIGAAAPLRLVIAPHARQEEMVRVHTQEFGGAIPVFDPQFLGVVLVKNVRNPRVRVFVVGAFTAEVAGEFALPLPAMLQ